MNWRKKKNRREPIRSKKSVIEILKEKGINPVREYKDWLHDIDTNPEYDGIIREDNNVGQGFYGKEIHEFFNDLRQWARDITK